MSPALEHLRPKSQDDKFLHILHKDRWNFLKPVIVELYTGNHGQGGKSTTLDEVVDFMKFYYSFHAA